MSATKVVKVAPADDKPKEYQYVKPSEKWDTAAHSATVASEHPMWRVLLAVGSTVYSIGVMTAAAAAGELDGMKMVLILLFMFFYIDIISGLLHLVLDNPGFLHTPGLTKLAEGFQQHHTNTHLISQMRLIDHLRPMCTPVAFVALIGGYYHGVAKHEFCAFQVGLMFGLVWMQCCHRWSHMTTKQRGPTITRLQKLGVALPPDVHLKHHTPPYRHTFCIMSGVFNPVLNWVVESHPLLDPHCKIWLPIFLCGILGGVFLVPAF